MLLVRAYVWVLKLSALLALLVLAYALLRLLSRRRREGLWILVSGLLGALVTSAVYTAFFTTGGGDLADALNPVGFYWAYAGFGWVGLLAALFDRERPATPPPSGGNGT
jgi:hypothetical protein